METHVALLRGINVGGKRKILMKDLKMVFEENGFIDVKTYIQSGNVVFKSNFLLKFELINQLEHYIESAFGFKVDVFVFTEQEWNHIISSVPFSNEYDESGWYVTFLNDEFDKLKSLTIDDSVIKDDLFVLDSKRVYLSVNDGYRNTKLTNSFFEKKIETSGTTRNWKTIKKIQSMFVD